MNLIAYPPGCVSCVLVIAALSLSACTKSPSPEKREGNKPERALPTPSAPKQVVQQPPLLTTPSPKAATPEPNRLTQAGVYFLKLGVSVETSDGIVGLRPGTRLVKKPDGRFLADGHTVELNPEQYTNDLRIAGNAATAENLAQAAMVRNSRQQAQPGAPKTGLLGTSGSGVNGATSNPNVPEHIAGVNTQSSGLQTSTALGAAHTRTKNGYVWQKTPDGLNWVTIKRIDGRPVYSPLQEPVR